MDLITAAWSAVETFISLLSAGLLDVLLEPMLQALFDRFFTFLFITLESPTLIFMCVLSGFMFVFFIKYVRNA